EQAVEEQPQAHTEAEAETFAADVVEVTEQVAESEKAQPEAGVVAQPEPVVEETPEPVAIEREELPLPEDVNAEEVSPEEWQAEAETVESVEAAEEEAAKEEITAEELEAQALAAEAAEEAVMVVPPAEEEQPVEEIAQEQEKPTKEGFFARLKRSLLKTKENLGSGFISLFRGKKIDDDLFEELEEQLLIADVGVET
ncbi:signal recognition particle-docking protein FtsY, partial [Enterobacter hormaechei]|uniref:signal recognition particle receptor subunit alpha n=1 Tax=Enterobacter hormaechei TaxID=158836 RepID=UPI001C707CD3